VARRRPVTRRAGEVQTRVRKLDADALWRIVLFRGLGQSEAEISSRLAATGTEVSQEAISYQLRRLRRVSAKPEDEYRVLAALMLASTTAIPYLMTAIVERAQRRGRR
jgi:arginine repressor